ncbi:MAG: hypoxanthine phosphoribosyltransferase [Gemmatimonadaceae bacterium]
MALLEGAAAYARDAVAAVATFDHGTGPSARAAAQLVLARAAALGLPAVAGRAAAPASDEVGWRRARWRFLADVAARHAARVATAHSEDDQIETVFMRALRGAGARGLAGLYAPSPVLRPFVAVRRATLAAFVAGCDVPFVEDPSNLSRRHLRNRVRLDLLPAIERVRPGFARELLDLARRSAEWRVEVDALARELVEPDAALSGQAARGELRVAAGRLAGLDARALAVLWPAVAAIGGVTLDRRGTRRLAEFTSEGRSGRSIQLSGGFEVVRRRDEFVLRALRDHTSSQHDPAGIGTPETSVVRLDGGSRRLGRWRFVPVRATEASSDDLWQACFAAGANVIVRPWMAGDRMRTVPGGAARRVKRFFGDAGIAGVDRSGWPVVLADGDVAWIPGVRRSAAATVPSGRPGLCYACHQVPVTGLVNPTSTESDPRLDGRALRRVAYDAETIAERVRELGAEITAAYPDDDLLVLGLLKGSFIFLSDLVREIRRPLQVDFLVASSYGDATVSSGVVRLVYDPETQLEGKHILLVEDIVDSGRTLNRLMGLLGERRPKSLEICALLHKQIATELRHPTRFVGFDAPHEFLVGYGLDHAENFRHLPYIASLQ